MRCTRDPTGLIAEITAVRRQIEDVAIQELLVEVESLQHSLGHHIHRREQKKSDPPRIRQVGLRQHSV